MFPPKKPSNHRITKITTIVHNMSFLLFGPAYHTVFLRLGRYLVSRFTLSSYKKPPPSTSINWVILISVSWGILRPTSCEVGPSEKKRRAGEVNPFLQTMCSAFLSPIQKIDLILVGLRNFLHHCPCFFGMVKTGCNICLGDDSQEFVVAIYDRNAA